MNDYTLGALPVPLGELPLVDLSPLHDDPAHRPALVDTIRIVGRELGFFYAYHHGIAEGLVERVWVEAARFFRLPDAQKMALYIGHNDTMRGYAPLREETLAKKGDLKESFDIALDLPEDDPDRARGARLYGPNVWPVVLPGFRSIIYDKYYQQVLDLARKVAGLFAQALDLPADYFDDKTRKPMCNLRLLHYPSQSAADDPEEIGCGVHTDYELFTILIQDSAGGLQVQRKDLTWIEAPHIPGTLLINVGDMLARWSNDRLRATPHRVINTSGRERFSLPFFFGPDYFCPVDCLPTCLDPGQPPRYAPVLAGEYLSTCYSGTFIHQARRQAHRQP